MGIATGAILWRRIKPKRERDDEVLLQEGFEQKHRYRKIDGPVDVDENVYKKEER